MEGDVVEAAEAAVVEEEVAVAVEEEVVVVEEEDSLLAVVVEDVDLAVEGALAAEAGVEAVNRSIIIILLSSFTNQKSFVFLFINVHLCIVTNNSNLLIFNTSL